MTSWDIQPSTRQREKTTGTTCLWESVLVLEATLKIPSPKQNLQPGNLFHPYNLACGADREQTRSQERLPATELLLLTTVIPFLSTNPDRQACFTPEALEGAA